MRKLLLLGLIGLAGIAGCQRTKTPTTPTPTTALFAAVVTPTAINTVIVFVPEPIKGAVSTPPTPADTPTPTPTSTPHIVRPASGPLPTTYVVQTGDNLYRISLHFEVPMYTIAAANGIRNIHYIRVGQVLCIPTLGGRCTPLPAPGAYVVRTGDTLYSIARRYGTTVEALMAANGLTSFRVEIGQVLIIPGGGGQPCPAGQYRVRTGDTVYSIAKAHDTTVEAIVGANGLVNYRIDVGQCLIIPGAPAPIATATPTPTGAPPTATPTTTPGTPAAPGEVDVYTSVEGGFSVEYPKGWNIETRDDSFAGYKAWLFKEAGDTAGVTGVIVMSSPTGDASVVLIDAVAFLSTLVPGRFGGGASVNRDYNGDGTDDALGDDTMDTEPAKVLLAKVEDGGAYTADLLIVAAMHDGKGYIYFATAPHSSWNQWAQQFMTMFKRMEFR